MAPPGAHDLTLVSSLAILDTAQCSTDNPAVPHRMACPRCEQVGLVRVETVIRGTKTSKLYYCGSCDYDWSIEDKPEPPGLVPPPQQRRPKSRTLGPKQRS